MEKAIDVWALTRTLWKRALTGAELPNGTTELLTEDALQGVLRLSMRFVRPAGTARRSGESL